MTRVFVYWRTKCVSDYYREYHTDFTATDFKNIFLYKISTEYKYCYRTYMHTRTVFYYYRKYLIVFTGSDKKKSVKWRLSGVPAILK